MADATAYGDTTADAAAYGDATADAYAAAGLDTAGSEQPIGEHYGVNHCI